MHTQSVSAREDWHTPETTRAHITIGIGSHKVAPTISKVSNITVFTDAKKRLLSAPAVHETGAPQFYTEYRNKA